MKSIVLGSASFVAIASLLLGGCYGGANVGNEPADDMNTADAGNGQDASAPSADRGMVTTPDAGTTCARELELCGDHCVNLQTDRNNCGVCGSTCGNGFVCAAGDCRVNCPSGQTACNGICVDTSSNTANCGACGRTCSNGQTCVAGACNTTPVADAGTTPPPDVSYAGHTIYFQNGSGVARPGVTVGSISNLCRSSMVIETWNNNRGGMMVSPPGGALEGDITPGRANVKFRCSTTTEIDLCAQFAAGRRNAADLFGSDAVIRVDGLPYAATQALIVRDIYAGRCAVVVSITEAPGSVKPGSNL